MTTGDQAPVVLLVVPPGTVSPAPLAAAVQLLHPAWRVVAVWAGDPHLRPLLDDLSWFDPDGEASTLRQVQLASRAPADAIWLRALAAARRALDEGAPSAVMLVAGAVAALGSLDALVPPVGAAAVFVPRAAGPLPDDGRAPGEEELVSGGSWSPHVAGVSSSDLIAWMSRLLEIGSIEGSIGAVLDRAAVAFAVVACHDPAIGVGEWRWDVEAPSLVDLPSFDPEQCWVLDPGRGHRARIDVAANPQRAAVLARAATQLAGDIAPVSLPGGVVVDDVIRWLVSRDGDCPAPWSAPAAFRAWLEPRYWSALHGVRRDLAASFPTPRGSDAERFRDWCRRAFVDDRAAAALGVPTEPAHLDRWLTADTLAADGINLVGYLTRELSLGDVARRIGRGLADAGLVVAPLAYQRTASPQVDGAMPIVGTIAGSSSIAVVNADQFPALAMDHPELFAAGTHLVGYWFWELEHVPMQMRDAAGLVDEIWVGSRFVADSFRAVVDTPVRHVPIPVPEPVVSNRGRATFPGLTQCGDRFVFAVVFDHFSVTERKNPVGAIEAFRRAFVPDEGPVLLIKSMNAERRWPQHQQVVAAVGDRPDIIVWDEHLDRPDHMALIGAVDALVSLHRSEGLGLHLAEAMWLGTPLIATRYSGNLDLMDDDCSVLIDASLVPVQWGEGVYPVEARWADPDLDQAAAAMRSLATDPSRCAALAVAGRKRMQRQPTLADTGVLIAGLLGIQVAS